MKMIVSELMAILNKVNEGTGCIDVLGKLVKSGVITKAQANLINQKIQIYNQLSGLRTLLSIHVLCKHIFTFISYISIC